jgi:acetoin utilization deacetylase AcuC-like enzyme
MHLFTHTDCLKHQMTPGHPERPQRLAAVLAHLEQTGMLADLQVQQAVEAKRSDLTRAHTASHIDFVYEASPSQDLTALDPLRAANLATGAVLQAVETVLAGTTDRAFCAVRPPGHHAEADGVMGFCLFNSIAIAAAAALEHPDVERVAILDFDVHHGNGTVDIFRDRPEVMVCSSFQHPYYPNRQTNVAGQHLVYTPLAEGTGSAEFRSAIERDWIPAVCTHQPDLILVSAGFDAHTDDPLASLNLGEDDFAWVTRLIVDLARDFSKGRIVSTLEGGYDLDALSRSVEAHLVELPEH